ncbi:motile sperm domain-containing protein 2-like [Limulus polyphemus]|uniref:Motile sperm domain-containing protein 2-like n=1 Tax=Limulus polyphemus TaxID=6850 RepID=A0ABM1BPU0_LIMPO|nr:motile sperm domain-containing protein 2-like [Limulus polyphemus]
MVRRLNKFINEVENFSGPEEVKELRQRVLKEIDENDWSGVYDPRDVQRLKDDDYFCKRVLRHRSGNMDAAVEIVKTVFKWRKEFGIHDLTEEDINPDIVSKGAVFTYNEDKERNPILILRVNCHRKDPATVVERKKIISYWIEKLERENKEGSVSVLLDCSDTGLTNMGVIYSDRNY